ncbi:hypothetical protein SMACR_08229 [Sordaria macrospora]|uniref:WGS project CABT00000000 data, contig 2.43 n=2 Tax=Sordaria macrospora TaxID=5147 RepID=F7W880_SORMK|nr:uncharacterized protein SMAC_08229 [Sordaria macrospora k-hell]KAA8628346.1 hypothetical protein SMACR_08229 [Sordaria macrospora]WPJ61083.1 hypothetical protein SMAC4_08229 [Sordaria macrospora]CCC13725.1 unnamed protein product [Sordaria macrospora k-hell]
MTDNQQQQAKPIYVATYGRDPKMAAAVSEKLMPDIEVVHTSLSLSTAVHELPLLFSGDTSITPASGLGSNTNLPPTERHIPTALLFGGGSLTDEEYERIVAAVREAIPGAESGTPVQFVRIGKRDVIAAGAFTGPNPETIAKREEEGRGGIGGRFGGGDGSPVGNDTRKDGTKGGTRNGNGNSKRFWQRCNSADSGIGIPDDNNMDNSEVRNDTLGAAIASGTSTSFTFAGSTGWRYISLSDDDHMYGGMHSPHADQDENVGLLGGMRFRGKNNKGKKVGMFASGIPEEDEHEDDDADGKKKGGGVKGKDGKCGEGWFETLMVHGFGSIAHLYVPCTDFITFEENDLGGRKEVVGAMMPRQAQAHIVIFDDGLGGIALRDL